jgi:hypothetical protein
MKSSVLMLQNKLDKWPVNSLGCLSSKSLPKAKASHQISVRFIALYLFYKIRLMFIGFLRKL